MLKQNIASMNQKSVQYSFSFSTVMKDQAFLPTVRAPCSTGGSQESGVRSGGFFSKKEEDSS